MSGAAALGRIVLGAPHPPASARGWRGGEQPAGKRNRPARPLHVKLLLWIAQGFGLGRVGFAPGTLGSGLGLAWLAGLLALGSLPLLVAFAALAVAFSIFCCGRAQRILRRPDPPSVVLDEMVAVPVCYFAWICVESQTWRGVPPPGFFFHPENWLVTLALFAAFRFFDIVKPWPVRQSQDLPGGWGVTMDDLLAAVYVNVVFLAGLGLKRVAS